MVRRAKIVTATLPPRSLTQPDRFELDDQMRPEKSLGLKSAFLAIVLSVVGHASLVFAQAQPGASADNNAPQQPHTTDVRGGVWTPPMAKTGSAQHAQSNVLNNISTQVSLPAGGGNAQRWATTNFINATVFNPQLPAFNRGLEPAAPSGMADSHTIGYLVFAGIAGGGCDGGGGRFSAGIPQSRCYSEVGGVDVQLYSLTPGHLLEGMSSQTFDDDLGAHPGQAVPVRMNPYTAAMFKDSLTNNYRSDGYICNSVGLQQGVLVAGVSYAPDSCFRVVGGLKFGLDLSDMGRASGTDIRLRYDHLVTTDPDHVYIKPAAGGGLNVSRSGASVAGQIVANNFVSTVPTGMPPLTVKSSTIVPNLNASLVNGADFASPGEIGAKTPGPISGTTISVSGRSSAAFFRPLLQTFTELSRADPSPQTGDRAVISDARSCAAQGAIVAQGGGSISCVIDYSGTAWKVAIVH